ncbi:hypothetical protein N8328_03545 [Crocinitomicaceae bacterium]|nr:hypothetical protein [Crocinitomicaceae bacterium]
MNSFTQFDVFSAISCILWLGIVVILAAWHYSSIREKSCAKYFSPTFYFKLISAVGFAVVHLYVYQDGGSYHVCFALLCG